MNHVVASRTAEAFEPRESIWAYIQSQTIEEERLEIKTLIGSSLIEETVDLHQEVNTLLEIWRDCREENFEQERALPEPPNVRENLIKQIQLFVKLLQEKSEKNSRDFTRGLSPFQTEVVKNIYQNEGRSSSAQQRPHTACSSRDRRETPLRPHSRTSASSCSSRLSDHFLEDNEPKTSDQIEMLADIIRENLEEERTNLHADIEFLQQCLFDESAFCATIKPHTEEPSLKDLQDIGLKLEKELLVTEPGQKFNSTKSASRKEKSEIRRSNSINSPQGSIHSQESVLSSAKPISPSGQRTAIPSPPSSAPTTKNRNNVIRRKPLPSKTFSFPTDDSFCTGIQETDTHASGQNESRTLTGTPPKRKTAATTTVVTKPCVVNSVGSNSQKLRQLVLDFRETNS